MVGLAPAAHCAGAPVAGKAFTENRAIRRARHDQASPWFDSIAKTLPEKRLI